MTEILIQREHDAGAWLRRVRVYIDDRKVAALRPGADATMTLTEGKHVLQAKLDWISSDRIELDCSAVGRMRITIAIGADAYVKTWTSPKTAIGVKIESPG